MREGRLFRTKTESKDNGRALLLEAMVQEINGAYRIGYDLEVISYMIADYSRIATSFGFTPVTF